LFQGVDQGFDLCRLADFEKIRDVAGFTFGHLGMHLTQPTTTYR
jgi:hypothetical protein